MRRFKQATAVALSAAMVMTSVFTTNVSAGAKTKKAVKSVKVTNVKGNKLTLMNSSLNPPFEMGDQAKPKRCLEY